MLPANISVLMFVMIMYIFFYLLCVDFLGGGGATTSIPIQSAVKFCHWDAAVQ